jgi:hypothetical protein
MDSRDDENERIRQLTEQNRQLADQLQQQAARIQQLGEELERLKQLLAGKADSKTAKTPVFKENYSLGRNARRQRKRRGVPSTGRRPKEQKREIIASAYDVSHADADPKPCVVRREQFAWRIIDGQAVSVGSRIHDLPDSKQLPLPPGLRTSRSEYGIEIIRILAFLHSWIGLSLDHACEAMRFFTKWELSTSQADSLLKQLATDWDEPYDTIAELIALQMIVSIDETGWNVGAKSCSTWVFSTTMHVLFRCGVSRLMDHPDCLFVFVEHPTVEATNNRSERNARREAEVRKGARTSQTAEGAQRRGVILTVLASLATRFQQFTLDHLLSEVTRWWETGRSIFQQELGELHQPNAPPALLAEM